MSRLKVFKQDSEVKFVDLEDDKLQYGFKIWKTPEK